MQTDPTHYLHALPIACILLGKDNNIHMLNTAAEMLLGVDANHAKGKPLSSLLAEDQALPAMVTQVFSGNHTLRDHEHSIKPLRGAEVSVGLTLVPVADAQGEVDEVLVMADAAVPHSQEHTARREVVRAAGTIAAMLAHEVKNPLSGIRGAAQLMAEEEGDTALPELICREVERIRELLDRFEFLSDGGVIATEEVNVHAALDDAASLVKQAYPAVRLEKYYDPSLPDVLARRDLLVQLFLNLAKNAAEALSEVENPILRLRTSYRGGVRTHLPDGGVATGHVAVTVEDNGPGIPAEIRATLFEPFVSTKEGSRGLGLAITSKIAADLGGVLELEASEPGSTRFCALLPCKP